jgi:hypothetical protein
MVKQWLSEQNNRMMKKYLRIYYSLLLAGVLTACASDKKPDYQVPPVETGDYYMMNVRLGFPKPGLILLEAKSYQQTTEYTCGPASVITLLQYYGITGDEMTIAGEMGTSSTCGTTPEQMTGWLQNHGFEATWSENGTLEMLRDNLVSGRPVLVEWSDWGGHWVLVIGYDTRDTEDLMDDVIIFADPYDHHDDNPDGIDWFNAQRFYYMWYDALLFGKVMRGIHIHAVPGKS